MSDRISRADAIAYIERVINSGLGRNKSLDYIHKYISALPSAEPTGDLISRADAMGAVQDHFNANGFKGYDDGQKMMDRIKAIPSAEAEWIPCSERLPRARESVLIATSLQHDNWVGEGCYWETTKNHVIWKGYRWNATYWDNEVIAWMPLPKPYREESEVKE